MAVLEVPSGADTNAPVCFQGDHDPKDILVVQAKWYEKTRRGHGNLRGLNPVGNSIGEHAECIQPRVLAVVLPEFDVVRVADDSLLTDPNEEIVMVRQVRPIHKSELKQIVAALAYHSGPPL